MAKKKAVKKKSVKKVKRASSVSVNSNVSKSSVKKYGGFWIRFLAAILDLLIIGAVSSVLTFGSRNYGGGLGIVIGWLYFALMESSNYQATLGKLAFNLKVTGIKGNKISFGRATGRHFAKYLSLIILCIGFIMVAFTEKKQGLHDLIAETLVVWK